MKKKQLFIIGTGRSGTTLIQRVINTFPDTMIWGEHAGFLKQLSELYYFLNNNQQMHEYSYACEVSDEKKFNLASYNDSKVWQAWINWFRPGDLKKIFRGMVEEFFCPTEFDKLSIWGFKEIRYGPDDRVLDFLAEIYPEATFLFVTRDSLNTIESQITTFHKGKSRYTKIKRLIQLPQIIKVAKNWKRQNALYLKLSQEHPVSHYLIRYEDASEDLTVLNSVLYNVDLEIGGKQLEVLRMKEGRGTNFQLNNTVHTRWKRMGLVPAFIAELIVGSTSLDIGYERPRLLMLATLISKVFKRRR